jgi:hypothetical protein
LQKRSKKLFGSKEEKEGFESGVVAWAAMVAKVQQKLKKSWIPAFSGMTVGGVTAWATAVTRPLAQSNKSFLVLFCKKERPCF